MQSNDHIFVKVLSTKNLHELKKLVNEKNYKLPITEMKRVYPYRNYEFNGWKVYYVYCKKLCYEVFSDDNKSAVEMVNYFIRHMRKQKIKELQNADI